MMIVKKLKTAAPFIMLFLLLSMLWHELYSAGTSKYSSSMGGEQLPGFSLPTLNGKTLSPRSMRGHVSILNVFASWCSACNAEHNMMMRIKNEYHVPIYGILYRDNGDEGSRWLANKGNPYVMVGNDTRGVTGADLGIVGTPKTFVISPEGKILYQHTGVVDQSLWENDIYPIIKQYAR